MPGIRNLNHSELLEVILLESWKHPCFENLVVADEHAYICTNRRGISDVILISSKVLKGPFSTSFISPGGDCKRNCETAWIRSSSFIDAMIVLTVKVGTNDEDKDRAAARRCLTGRAGRA